MVGYVVGLVVGDVVEFFGRNVVGLVVGDVVGLVVSVLIVHEIDKFNDGHEPEKA